jgi:hypothetical protein
VRRWLFAIVAFVLALAVCLIFVSPAVDLDPTTMRASQQAALLFFGLAFLATVVVGSTSGSFWLRFRGWSPGLAATSFRHPPSVLDFSCSRLC